MMRTTGTLTHSSSGSTRSSLRWGAAHARAHHDRRLVQLQHSHSLHHCTTASQGQAMSGGPVCGAW
jgi:hypothetical protein